MKVKVSEKHCGKTIANRGAPILAVFDFSEKQQVIHSVKTQMCAIQTGLKS